MGIKKTVKKKKVKVKPEEKIERIQITHRPDKVTSPWRSRYGIGNVLAVPIEGGGVFTASTDGNVLAVIEETRGHLENQSLIPAALIPKNKGGGSLFLRDKNWETMPEGVGNIIQKAAEGNKDFPDVADVMPDLTPEHISISFEPKLLMNLSEAIQGKGGKYNPSRVTMLFKLNEEKTESDGKPMICVFGESSGVGVVIPLAAGDTGKAAAKYKDVKSRFVKAFKDKK